MKLFLILSLCLPAFSFACEIVEGLEVCTSTKEIKHTIGPFKIQMPDGWSYSKSKINENRFVYEMTPDVSRNFTNTKVSISFTYFPKKEKKYEETLKKIKLDKNKDIKSFSIGNYKGIKALYKADGMHREVSMATNDKSSILIMKHHPDKNMPGLEKFRISLN